jgi:uncharacterized protein with PhoU and TrkA domain
MEFFKMILFPCCIKGPKLKKKVKLYRLAMEKMQKKFEITYVMKRLEEVEKLKSIIIPENQISLFESAAKEICSLKNNGKYPHHPKIKIIENENEKKNNEVDRNSS